MHDSDSAGAPVAIFVSDVHLQAAMPRTTQAFLDFLRDHAARAERLYLLGDLFEYWAGDDDIGDPYHRRISDALRAVHDAGTRIFWIAGNRDFLVGAGFASATGAVILPDPSIVEVGGLRIVLTHGDAQCTDDPDYMAFRAQVRQPEWQREFLALPLARRKAIIDGMRSGSREAQRMKSAEIMDVNRRAIDALFDASGAPVMIHGHTHRPAVHEHTAGVAVRTRHVLPDWDCEGAAVRGGWLEMDAAGGFTRVDCRPAASPGDAAER